MFSGDIAGSIDLLRGNQEPSSWGLTFAQTSSQPVDCDELRAQIRQGLKDAVRNDPERDTNVRIKHFESLLKEAAQIIQDAGCTR
jgi:hypothetical protein